MHFPAALLTLAALLTTSSSWDWQNEKNIPSNEFVLLLDNGWAGVSPDSGQPPQGSMSFASESNAKGNTVDLCITGNNKWQTIFSFLPLVLSFYDGGDWCMDGNVGGMLLLFGNTTLDMFKDCTRSGVHHDYTYKIPF